MSSSKNENTYYRDRLSTVDSEGHRNWVYAKKPKGKFFNKRKVLAKIPASSHEDLKNAWENCKPQNIGSSIK